MSRAASIRQRWEEGELTNEEALEALTRELAILKDKLEPLQMAEKELRNDLSLVVERMGGQAEVEGFASLSISSAVRTYSYDRRGLDDLVKQLQTEGHRELADRILQYRQEGSRAGGLRIVPFRQRG